MEEIDKRVLEWENKNFTGLPNNFCETEKRYLQTEEKEQYLMFKKNFFEKRKEKTSNPYYSATATLKAISNSQTRFFLLNNKYSKDFSSLDLEFK